MRDYFALCQMHPNKERVPPCNASAQDIIALLSKVGDIRREGKGREATLVLSRAEQPQALRFLFWVEYRSGIEACLNVIEGVTRHGSSFAALAAAAAEKAGIPPNDPPYPRPSFYSLDELKSIVVSLHDMALRFGRRYLVPNP